MSSLLTSDLKIGGFFSLGKIQRRRVSSRARVRMCVCMFHEPCMFECIFSRMAYFYKQENILVMRTESHYGKSCLI